MNGVVVSTGKNNIPGIQRGRCQSRCARFVTPVLVRAPAGQRGVRLRRGVAERIVRRSRRSRSRNGRGIVGVGFVGVLRARKDDAVVSIFIKGADGRERAGVSGDELSRNGLRSGVVNRSIRGSKRWRNASCLLGEQHSVIVGVGRSNRERPVQGDF